MKLSVNCTFEVGFVGRFVFDALTTVTRQKWKQSVPRYSTNLRRIIWVGSPENRRWKNIWLLRIRRLFDIEFASTPDQGGSEFTLTAAWLPVPSQGGKTEPQHKNLGQIQEIPPLRSRGSDDHDLSLYGVKLTETFWNASGDKKNITIHSLLLATFVYISIPMTRTYDWKLRNWHYTIPEIGSFNSTFYTILRHHLSS
jgi:hypothetical protein